MISLVVYILPFHKSGYLHAVLYTFCLYFFFLDDYLITQCFTIIQWSIMAMLPKNQQNFYLSCKIHANKSFETIDFGLVFVSPCLAEFEFNMINTSDIIKWTGPRALFLFLYIYISLSLDKYQEQTIITEIPKHAFSTNTTATHYITLLLSRIALWVMRVILSCLIVIKNEWQRHAWRAQYIKQKNYYFIEQQVKLINRLV